MSGKDDILDILKSNYAVHAEQSVYAQWNHNKYNQPLIYGYYHSNASAKNYISTDIYVENMYSMHIAETAAISMSSSTPVEIGTYYCSMNKTYSLHNCIRLIFDAKIDTVSSEVGENINQFFIQVVPKDGSQVLTEYVDMINIELIEGVYSKQELLFSSNYFDINNYFDRVTLSIIPVNDLAGRTVSVKLKNICISTVTRDEIEESQFYRIKDIFNPRRPGDQILENNLITASINPVTKYFVAADTFCDGPTNPELLPTLISPFNENIYFMSPPSEERKTSYNSRGYLQDEYTLKNGHNFFVEYASVVPTNQIYIKTQNFNTGQFNQDIISTIDKIEVYAKIDSDPWAASCLIYSASDGDFIDNGSIILQYDGTNWQEGFNLHGAPVVSEISGSFNNYKNIKALHVVCYADAEKSRIRMVEISPRLYLNLSNFLISTEYERKIDDGDLAIPTGVPKASDGTIVLENLPRWTNPTSESGSLYQIFNNNDNSPLKGLIKSDVKFIVTTTISDTKSGNTSASIKNFTMYAKAWENKDIETVSIELNDYGNFLQSTDSPDLLLMNSHQPKKSGTIQKVIESTLQLAGFSDYDVDSLATVSSNLKKINQATIPVFYCSNENKLWDTLTEVVQGYQTSMYFDENGILKFQDILRGSVNVSSYSNGNFYRLTSSATNGYLPNIISFSVTKKEDVGEITVNYRQMSATNNIYDANGNIFDSEKMKIEARYTRRESNSSTPPWEPTENRALICANIISDVGITDTKIAIGDYNHNDKDEARFITGFKGLGIIEGEIISWDGISYSFTQIPGFPTNEVIKSQDELADAISERISYLSARNSISKFRFFRNTSGNFVSASFSDSHTFKAGEKLQVQLQAYNSSGSNSVYKGTTPVYSIPNTTTVVFRIPTYEIFNKCVTKKVVRPGATSASNIGVSTITSTGGMSYASRSEENITYQMTGSLCNVQRGLYGTNAAVHRSNNYSDPSAFFEIGSLTNKADGINIPAGGLIMQKKVEANNATNFTFTIPGRRIGYLGFSGRDRRDYTRYRYSVIPTNDIDSFGIFFGAELINGTSGSTFKNNTGYFIEFFPATETSQKYGVIVRRGPDPNSPPLYISKDKFLYDKWVKNHYKMVPIKGKDGKVVKDENGNIKKQRKLIKTPPKKSNILVEFKNQKINKITVNGKVVNFYEISAYQQYENSNSGTRARPPQKTRSLDLSIDKRQTTFGVFSRNTGNKSIGINILEIQAVGDNQPLDQLSSWQEGGNSAATDSITTMLAQDSGRSRNARWSSFKHSSRPFSLRATPFIRGIEINEEKWQGEVPYYDLYTQKISGMNGRQVVPDNAVENSSVIGTPFRGKWGYKNKMDEVVYTFAGGESYTDGRVYGKSIDILGDRSLKRKIDNPFGQEKVEVTLNWSSGVSTARNVIEDIARNINVMNNIYEVEVFGNPAISLGDNVILTYPEQGIINKKVVVISISNSFSDGGISTDLVLRDIHA